MFNQVVLISILVISLFSTSFSALACNIAGIWNHTAKPAKLFIDVNKGEISVHSHEVNPKSVGLVVLKSLTPGNTTASWVAKMYSAAEASYVDVQITAKSCKQLVVHFRGEDILELKR